MQEYDDYFEPGEFEEKIEEFKDCLRESVKQKINEEKERLIKENRELKDRLKNLDKLEKECHDRICELKKEKSRCESEASQKRLSELFKDVGMSLVLYKPSLERVYLPKCKKCDEHRYIHFKSPSGKDMEEKCECNKYYSKHVPREYVVCEFKRRSNCGYKSMYFNVSVDGEYENFRSMVTHVYSGEDFGLLYEKFGGFPEKLYFREKETCQKYCDFLNAKDGIKPNTTEEL